MNCRYSKTVIYFLFIITVCFFNTTYAANYRPVKKIIPFQEEIIHFSPATIPDGAIEENGVIRLGNGRVILKKVKLPRVKRDIRLKANIILTSNGDPWDKAGSCFIIPAESTIDMVDIALGKANYPQVNPNYTENLAGVIPTDGFIPPVEIMRFMTPFGVGYFNEADSITTSRKKPVYIDEWAPHVEWQQDISSLYSLLTEEVYIGVFIDTWTKEGYKLSLTLELLESEVKQDKLKDIKVLPLVNTVYYQGQSHPDIFARQKLEVPFTLPQKAKNVKLKYIVTGHGGHSGGDEFVKNENILSIDDNEIYRFTPWRTDCASFRRFNPSTGVWLTKREVSYISKEGRTIKTIEEPIASSDLSRSNWCPGSHIDPVTIALDKLEAGEHRLFISIPEAQAMAENEMNHWLVSAYLVWEE